MRVFAGSLSVLDRRFPLGRQLHMIYDGASLSARMDRDPSAAAAARTAAETLLDAALAAR